MVLEAARETWDESSRNLLPGQYDHELGYLRGRQTASADLFHCVALPVKNSTCQFVANVMPLEAARETSEESCRNAQLAQNDRSFSHVFCRVLRR